jgi:hypothetical protein
MRREDGEEHLTSRHSNVEVVEKDVSVGDRISPNRVDPKKAVVQAAQMTCLSRLSQSVAAIFFPRWSRRGKVMTRLVVHFSMNDGLTCFIPLNSKEEMLSVDKWSAGKPLTEWRNFRADKYVRMEL